MYNDFIQKISSKGLAVQKNNSLFLRILILLIIASCNPAPEALATQTAEALTTLQANWTDTPQPTVTLTAIPTLTATVSPDEIKPCFMKPTNFESYNEKILDKTQNASFPKFKAKKWVWKDNTGRDYSLEKQGVKGSNAILKFLLEDTTVLYFSLGKEVLITIPFYLDEEMESNFALIYLPMNNEFIDLLCPKRPERFTPGLPDSALEISFLENGDVNIIPSQSNMNKKYWCYGPFRDYYLPNGELISWQDECPSLEIIKVKNLD